MAFVSKQAKIEIHFYRTTCEDSFNFKSVVRKDIQIFMQGHLNVRVESLSQAQQLRHLSDADIETEQSGPLFCN